jgi:hypothetical protein
MLLGARLLLIAAAAVVLVATAACGGTDYSGAVEVPRGYETVHEAGVSYVRPAGFRGVGEIKTAAGLRQTPFGDPRTRRTPQALVTFSTEPHAREAFERRVSETRVVAESTGAEVKVHQVDVPGAEKAFRLRIDAPRTPGSDPADTHGQMLMVLLRDGTAVSLVASAPDRDRAALDAAAVIDSFRVESAP